MMSPLTSLSTLSPFRQSCPISKHNYGKGTTNGMRAAFDNPKKKARSCLSSTISIVRIKSLISMGSTFCQSVSPTNSKPFLENLASWGSALLRSRIMIVNFYLSCSKSRANSLVELLLEVAMVTLLCLYGELGLVRLQTKDKCSQCWGFKVKMVDTN